ncbi:hypothetical protein [Edaphobacter albus]|uniref:hypothetical protein n=1 Tax=Edaphobacter sp. 4G125 TaxID=2763071 RepID=UPI0016489E21|nr:hypothetical protein [Edaphobacter sp. 4G125]QNI36204.1 hypothetical protein H7846_14620 [Edaphobacter sp. 4G125]
MKLTPDTQKKAVAVGVFVLVAVGILYYQLSDNGSASRPAQPVITTTPATNRGLTSGTAKSLGTTAAQLDPTLKMGPMLVTEQLVYSGTGRNIFSLASAPIEIPKPVASARPKPTGPVFTPPSGPPPPPPIDLKFFGTEMNSQGKRRAFLLHGDDVFLAADGDIVQRRYRILSVSANSVQVEDMTNNNRQTLPLIAH